MFARLVSRLLLSLSLSLFVFASGYSHEAAHKHSHAQAQAKQSTGDIKVVKPESVGFESDGLKKMEESLQGIVDKKQLSGVVTLLARHGEVVQYKAIGYQSLENKTPMKLDTIFRIYSMTKPTVGAAMM